MIYEQPCGRGFFFVRTCTQYRSLQHQSLAHHSAEINCGLRPGSCSDQHHPSHWRERFQVGLKIGGANKINYDVDTTTPSPCMNSFDQNRWIILNHDRLGQTEVLCAV